MIDLFEYFCNHFEQKAKTEQAKHWETLMRPLIWHELNIISHRRYFTKEECLNIEAVAKDTARLLILPSVKKMEFDVLLEETAIRWLIIGFFNNVEVYNRFAHLLYPAVRNEFIFRDSLEWLCWQWRICLAGLQEVVERICNNMAAYYTLGATEKKDLAYATDLQEYLYEQTSWMSLPEYKRIDKIDNSVNDWLLKLMQMPVMERYKNSFLTAQNVERDLNDEYRRLTKTKKGNVEAGMKSLDEEVETEDGDTAPMLELIPAPPNTGEIEIEFTEQREKTLREFLNETDVHILKAIINDPDATQKEIAQQVGCAQPKVSKAINEKIKPNWQRIKKIFELY